MFLILIYILANIDDEYLKFTTNVSYRIRLMYLAGFI